MNRQVAEAARPRWNEHGVQKWLVCSAVAGSVLVLAEQHLRATVDSGNQLNPESSVPEAKLRQAPLTIASSTVGRFSKGYSWYLSVNSAGQAQLTIDTSPTPVRRTFVVSSEQLAELRKVLLDERFFELKEEYGEVVPDGSIRTVTVTVGDETRSVRLHFLMNWAQNDRTKLREPCRAVRVGLVIRKWFDDAEAVDLRKYDKIILEAVEKEEKSNDSND